MDAGLRRENAAKQRAAALGFNRSGIGFSAVKALTFQKFAPWS
jgi:hypothetical protein